MTKIDLHLDKPLMNAAGMLGFSPDLKGPVDITGFGAFVTNPVSWRPRLPAQGERFLAYSGGFLIHTGHPNPGLRRVLQGYARRWAQSPVPVIVHLLVQEADSLRRMVERLEGIEGVLGIEIGLPPEIGVDQAYAAAVAALGELPVIVRLPFERSEEVALGLVDTGISALSLNAPRGTLPDREGGFISGRLYGPGILPQALAAVQTLAKLGLPVIGAGGVYTQADIDTMFAAGATGVQLDTILWKNELPV